MIFMVMTLTRMKWLVYLIHLSGKVIILKIMIINHVVMAICCCRRGEDDKDVDTSFVDAIFGKTNAKTYKIQSTSYTEVNTLHYLSYLERVKFKGNKRRLDSFHFIRNIHYLCKLIFVCCFSAHFIDCVEVILLPQWIKIENIIIIFIKNILYSKLW